MEPDMDVAGISITDSPDESSNSAPPIATRHGSCPRRMRLLGVASCGTAIELPRL